MTGLLVIAVLAVLALAANLRAPYRGCRRWAPAHRWVPAHHRAARTFRYAYREVQPYRPRHCAGTVARPARLPLAVWSAQLAGGTS